MWHQITHFMYHAKRIFRGVPTNFFDDNCLTCACDCGIVCPKWWIESDLETYIEEVM